jgi:CTP synthase (UTP-ammonia lyase)
LLGIAEADHAETSPDGDALVVSQLSCSLAGQAQRVHILPGSRAAALYDATESGEDYFCRYALEPGYRSSFEAAGLRVTGVGGDGEARIVELDSHPFFVATLYCFQTRSEPGRPHPLVAGFVNATRQLRP